MTEVTEELKQITIPNQPYGYVDMKLARPKPEQGHTAFVAWTKRAGYEGLAIFQRVPSFTKNGIIRGWQSCSGYCEPLPEKYWEDFKHLQQGGVSNDKIEQVCVHFQNVWKPPVEDELGNKKSKKGA